MWHIRTEGYRPTEEASWKFQLIANNWRVSQLKRSTTMTELVSWREVPAKLKGDKNWIKSRDFQLIRSRRISGVQQKHKLTSQWKIDISITVWKNNIIREWVYQLVYLFPIVRQQIYSKSPINMRYEDETRRLDVQKRRRMLSQRRKFRRWENTCVEEMRNPTPEMLYPQMLSQCVQTLSMSARQKSSETILGLEIVIID